MLLAVVILVLAGLYVFLRRKVQVSSSLAIQGRPARQIAIILILGGLLSYLLPDFLSELGVLKGFVSGLILAIAITFATLIIVALVVLREKRRQAGTPPGPAPGDNYKA